MTLPEVLKLLPELAPPVVWAIAIGGFLLKVPLGRDLIYAILLIALCKTPAGQHIDKAWVQDRRLRGVEKKPAERKRRAIRPRPSGPDETIVLPQGPDAEVFDQTKTA